MGLRLPAETEATPTQVVCLFSLTCPLLITYAEHEGKHRLRRSPSDNEMMKRASSTKPLYVVLVAVVLSIAVDDFESKGSSSQGPPRWVCHGSG